VNRQFFEISDYCFFREGGGVIIGGAVNERIFGILY
jgi:hypothetical protein